VADKQAVIEEILETLNRHGLTVADLRSSY
jgi:glycine cleavage system regulatory protein